MLEHLKEAFPPMIETQIPKIDYIDTTTGTARVLVLLFKLELPQSMSLSMLVHMTDRNNNTSSTEQDSMTIPSMFHEAFCKT